MRNRVWKKKGIILCLAVLAVCACGCGKKEPEDGAARQAEQADEKEQENTGTLAGYREFDVSLPEGTEDIFAIREAKGTCWLITGQTVYSSKDQGETWEIASAKAASPETYSAAAISAEASMAFALKEGSIFVQKPDGAQQTIDGIFTNGGVCYTLEFADENTLLAGDVSSNLQIIDISKGTVTGNIPAEGEYHYLAAPVGGEILTLTGEGAKYYGYEGELRAGNEVVNHLLSQDIADFNSHKQGTLIPDLGQNGFFYACKRGLYHYASGGSVTEQLIEGAANSMGDGAYNFYKMAALSDQSFFIVYRKDEGGAAKVLLKKYTANNAEAPAGDGEDELEGELTVYLLHPNRLLEEEVNTINRSHPNCRVVIETGLTDEAGLTLDDAVKTLNTEILAGNGPDILFLDGMSAQQYCESGLLADLSDVLKEAEKKEGVYEKIAYAYEKDGAVYAIPTRFQFPIMIGAKDALQRITDLDALVNEVRSLKEQHPEQAGITGLYGEGLLEYLFDFCAPAWMDESGQIDTEKLKKFLEAAREISDIQKEGVSEADVEAITSRYVYSDDNAELEQPMAVKRGDQSLAFYHSKSLNFSKTLLSELQDNTYDFDMARGQSANVFLPKEIIAVNAKSQNPAAAETFVKEFLSSGVQSTFRIEDTAYPVNRTAFADMKEQEIQREGSSGTQADLYKKGFQKIESIIEQLSVCSVSDTVIRDAVREYGLRCLSGEITVEEAADGIAQKVSLHMAE